MISDLTFTEIKNSFLAISGLSSLTHVDEFFLQGSINLSVKKAYNSSVLWPRYLVIGEQRTISTNPAYTVPFTQASKNDIGEFIKIHRDEPYVLISSLEYNFIVSSSGAKLLNFNSPATSVYVTYKKNLVTNYTPDSTDIPSEFRDYIIYSALADFYTGDGQNEKAIFALQMANDNLAIELTKLEAQSNNNIITRRISTHGTKQSRN